MMITKRLRRSIGKDKTIVIHLPDMPEGEVEILILKKRSVASTGEDVDSLLPKHRVGKILSRVSREEIYNDGR